MGRKKKLKKEEIAEDWCFACKDGGSLIICDYKDCLKAYHPACVNKDYSQIKTKEKWTCDLHYCFECNKAPKFYCLCCTSAICGPCLDEAEFAIVKGDKGLCDECLKLALLIEEKKDIDSNGRKIDFSDPSTEEYFFCDYWRIIKEKECLTSEQVISAYNQLKTYGNNRFASDSDEFDIGEEKISRKRKRSKGKQSTMKPLLEFLASIGKDATQELSKQVVATIINEYCKENNLFHPERKKKIICDARLQSLFGRKSVEITKLYKLLTTHLPENLDRSKDEFEYSSKNEDDSVACKRKLQSSSLKQSHSKEVFSYETTEAQGAEPAGKDSTGTNEQEHNVGIPELPHARTSEDECQLTVYDDLADIEEYNPCLCLSEKREISNGEMSVKKDKITSQQPMQSLHNDPVVFVDAQHAEPTCKVYSRRNRQEFCDGLLERTSNGNGISVHVSSDQLELLNDVSIGIAVAQHVEPLSEDSVGADEQDSLRESSLGRTSEGNAIPCHVNYYLPNVSAAPPSGPSTAVFQSKVPEASAQITSTIEIIDVKDETAEINLLGERHAFFANLQPLLGEYLERSSQQASVTITLSPEEIIEAKRCLNQCCSMNFEQLIHHAERNQFLSTLDLLLKHGYFPMHMLDMVTDLRLKFLSNKCLYSECQESVRRADEERECAKSLKQELTDNCSLHQDIERKVEEVDDKIEELRNQLKDARNLRKGLEEQSKSLMESSKVSYDALYQYEQRFETLEKSKQNGQQLMKDINDFWISFKIDILNFLLDS